MRARVASVSRRRRAASSTRQRVRYSNGPWPTAEVKRAARAERETERARASSATVRGARRFPVQGGQSRRGQRVGEAGVPAGGVVRRGGQVRAEGEGARAVRR
ncbi:hypothetical protein SNE510_06940 [Streptomyces sp. NE5-10]|nr:hypothetical protein SNE510_06940 [Streptomyces sp. NE5-10]